MADSPASRSWDIATLAKEVGVSSRTIRYYGELGLLNANKGRGPRGCRVYSHDALERLRFIVRLKQLGLTLEQIAELNLAFTRGQTRAMLNHLDQILLLRRAELTERLAELQQLDQDLTTYQRRIREKRARLDAKRHHRA
jgi:DNA-binding transcriptional MerR regulator